MLCCKRSPGLPRRPDRPPHRVICAAKEGRPHTPCAGAYGTRSVPSTLTAQLSNNPRPFQQIGIVQIRIPELTRTELARAFSLGSDRWLRYHAGLRFRRTPGYQVASLRWLGLAWLTGTRN